MWVVFFMFCFFRAISEVGVQIHETAFICGLTRRGYEMWHHRGKSFFGRTEISLDVPASLRKEQATWRIPGGENLRW